jgi:hypothetical protein
VGQQQIGHGTGTVARYDARMHISLLVFSATPPLDAAQLLDLDSREYSH